MVRVYIVVTTTFSYRILQFLIGYLTLLLYIFAGHQLGLFEPDQQPPVGAEGRQDSRV